MRRFSRFTIRFYLLLFLLASGPLAWYGQALRAWTDEQEVIRELSAVVDSKSAEEQALRFS